MFRFVIGGRQVVWEKAESTRVGTSSHPFPSQRLEPVVAAAVDANVTPRAAEK
jgi:hypothetical protein